MNWFKLLVHSTSSGCTGVEIVLVHVTARSTGAWGTIVTVSNVTHCVNWSMGYRSMGYRSDWEQCDSLCELEHGVL